MASEHDLSKSVVVCPLTVMNHPDTVQAAVEGCDPVYVRRAGNLVAVVYNETDSIHDFASAMEKTFNVSLFAQRYIGRRTRVMDMSSAATRSALLKQLAGKRLLLLGKSNLQLPPEDESAKSENSDKETRARKLRDAQDRLAIRLKRDLAANIYGSILTEAFGAEEDVKIHPRFRGNVPGLGIWMLQKFRSVLGKGLIPHLVCTHVSQNSWEYGCVECIENYIVDWYTLVLLYTRDELNEARNLAGPYSDNRENDLIEELREESELLEAQFAEGIKLGAPSPLSNIITDWTSEIIRRIDVEIDHTDIVQEDIKSFYKAMEMLEGGLGPARYGWISKSRAIVDVRLLDEKGNTLRCF